jgi:eukaryotic-like serine/threonine-protein kinase
MPPLSSVTVHRPGDIIDERYQLTRPLGKRGSAEIWEAEHEVVGRKVNLKLLSGDVALDPDLRERFIGEARAASVIAHPSAVEVFDVGVTPEGIAYLVTEPLGGEVLSDLIARQGGLPPEDACQLALHVLEGLEAAHAAGIVHGSLTPASIVLRRGRGEQVTVKILDFGREVPPSEDDATETRPGPDVDLRAMGAVLYEMLTGHPAFPQETPLASNGSAAMGHTPVSALAPAVPTALGDIVGEVLARGARSRVPSAKEMAKVIAPFASPRRPSVAPRESQMPFLSPEARRSRGMARLERAVLGKSEARANAGARGNVVIIGPKSERGGSRSRPPEPRVELEDLPRRAPGPSGASSGSKSQRPASAGARRLDPADLIEPRIPRPPRTPEHFASAMPVEEPTIPPARVRLPRRRSNHARQRTRLHLKTKSRPERLGIWAGLLAAASLGAGLILAHFLHF